MGDEIADYGILRLRMTFQFHAIAATGKTRRRELSCCWRLSHKANELRRFHEWALASHTQGSTQGVRNWHSEHAWGH